MNGRLCGVFDAVAGGSWLADRGGEDSASDILAGQEVQGLRLRRLCEKFPRLSESEVVRALDEFISRFFFSGERLRLS